MVIKKDDYVLIKKIVSLLKPYKKKIIIIFLCILISSGLNILLPLISKEIMDHGLLIKDFNNIVKLSILSLMMMLLDQGIGIIETKNLSYINSLLSYSLSKKSFKHLLKLRMEYFNNTNFAEIINNISIDVDNISRISDRSMFFIISGIFKMVGGFVGLVLIDWKLSILVILLIPIRFILVKYLAKKRMDLLNKYLEYNQKFSFWYGDTISGVKEIKLLGLQRLRIGQFIKNQRKIIKSNITLQLIDKWNELSETVLFQVLTSMLYIIGGWMIIDGNNLTVGGLFAFISYSIYVTSPLFAILNIGYNFTSILPSAKRLFSFLDMETEMGKAHAKLKRLEKHDVKGEISFENVSFGYKEKEQLLKNISFKIKEGEKVALIGINGSGKSTIINLLLRLLEPDEGRILLDGKDINELFLKDYRQVISSVSQDMYLFDTTIKENIAPLPEVDDIKVYKAAIESGAQHFIDNLPQKYQSPVGRNGSNLSGGERQKVAMARALARESKILILDEATSNYDIESELKLNELLVNKVEKKTILAITHKPHLLKMFDSIIFLGKGAVIDRGSHVELMERNDEYWNLVNSFEENNMKVV